MALIEAQKTQMAIIDKRTVAESHRIMQGTRLSNSGGCMKSLGMFTTC